MPFLGKVPSQIVDSDVDIDGGTIDGATIGSITAGAGTFTNLSATGTITFPDDGISGDDINGGTISNFTSTGIDDNATSTAITIDSSQRVGIGTTSPSDELEVYASNNSARVRVSGAGNSANGVQLGLVDSVTGVLTNTENGAFIFGTNNTERMRIDSSGNLLVGTTDTNPANDASGTGVAIGSEGWVAAARSGDTAGMFNRLSSDGNIVSFHKDGTTVGSVACRSSGGNLQIDTVQSGIDFSGAGWLPMRNGAIVDNDLDLGSASFRFDDVYATNGTIQTSDVNEKQDIETLSEAETRVAVAAKALLRKFRWKSAVEEKGDDARIHFGIIAQDLQAAFEAEGLDAGRYAMFIHSTWTDEETGEERSRMGVRYSELLAFIIAAI